MITEGRKINHEKKSVSYSGFILDELIEIITTGIILDGYAKDTLRTSIRTILFDYSLELPLTLNDLSRLLESKLKSSKGREKKYILLSGFYLKGSLSFSKIKTPNALITLKPAAAVGPSMSKFIDAQNAALKDHRLEPQIEFPLDQTIAKVFVKGRSPREAADKAIDALDQLRGLLNFSFNSRKINSKSIGEISETRVFNGIVGFRFQSLHDENAKIIKDGLFYTRAWDKSKAVARLISSNDKKTETYFLKAVARLRSKHGLHNEAWKAAQIYCRALDTPTYQNAFAKLWGVMEYLSGVTATDSHDKIVTRNAFLFSDPNYVRLTLNHLRANRNELIHAGTELDVHHEEVLIYQLNRYVCKLLARYIFNGFNFKNRQEFISFLDLPVDVNQLKQKYEIVEKAYNFRR